MEEKWKRHNLLVRNSSQILTTNDKYQIVHISHGNYLIKLDRTNWACESTGWILDPVEIGVIIGSIKENKVHIIENGDPAQSEYFFVTHYLYSNRSNIEMLKDLENNGFDVSLVPKIDGGNILSLS